MKGSDSEWDFLLASIRSGTTVLRCLGAGLPSESISSSSSSSSSSTTRVDSLQFGGKRFLGDE